MNASQLRLVSHGGWQQKRSWLMEVCSLWVQKTSEQAECLYQQLAALHLIYDLLISLILCIHV